MSIFLDPSTGARYLWYPFYLNALSESNPTRMRLRIKDAERFLLARERFLNLSSDSLEEREALAATLLALRALSSCLEPRDSHSDAA